MTKIDIISGFLGAGKTTLIKKLIQEAFGGEKIVLIENEFGEIGIDGGFLRDSGVHISELAQGCICCSLVGDFAKALAEVKARFDPDRILIEPSGVGKLSDVIAAVEKTVAQQDDMCLNSCCAVADGRKAAIYINNFGEFYNDQIASAGAVILSRTQKMTGEKLARAVEEIRKLNRDAAILTTPWDEVDGKAVLAAMEKKALVDPSAHVHPHDGGHAHHHHHRGHTCTDPHCDCHGHHHHADEVFVSWGAETVKAFTQPQLMTILAALDSGEYGTVLRAKGILPAEGGGWLHFDYVPEEHEVRSGAADYTGRLCVIGADLNAEKLAQLFAL